MAKLFKKADLPHFRSTRDTRDRLDLVKPEGPAAGKWIAADRIVYHPGDSAAKHYHKDAYHMFYILEGEGWIFVNEGAYRLTPGMVAAVKPDELHWFKNETEDNFIFVEFWAPPPSETVWVTDDC